MPDHDVIIIGAGPAGLSTAGALKKIGLEAVILDKDERLAGTWFRRYQRLHLHTVRDYSGLAHFAMPRHYPKYVPKNLFAEYLVAYADHFNLNIQLDTQVRKVRSEEQTQGSGWRIETDNEHWHARAVVLATGPFSVPVFPDLRTTGEYGGHYLHAAQYTRGEKYTGLRVLVIGAGNSGTEIAVDLMEQGADYVAISIRTPPAVVPRDFLGTPAQVFGILLSPLPPRLADRIGSSLARLALGDLTRHGLGTPAWQPFEAARVPVIDVGFAKALKAGSIQIRPGVHSLTSTGVVYQDGQREAFDVIIAATGYRPGLSDLLDVEDVLDEKGHPLFPQGQPTPHPGLFFMGFVRSHRGHLFEDNHASRRLAKTIELYLLNSKQHGAIRP